MIENYIKLMRVKHWIKNSFILIPLFFSKNLFNISLILNTLEIFFLFCLGSSLVYIVNDICDVERDRRHPRKCNRPVASGRISESKAKIFAYLIIFLIVIVSYFSNYQSVLIVLAYIIMNMLYSIKPKHQPILDVLIIAIGFMLRVMAGGLAINVPLSSWLMITIFSLSMFLGFGKRRNELINIEMDNHREVLKYYKISSLDSFSTIFSGMFLVFYSLYCFEGIVKHFYITIPLVVYGLLKYSLLLQNENNEGDPTEILLNDTGIKNVCLLYGLIALILLYFV